MTDEVTIIASHTETTTVIPASAADLVGFVSAQYIAFVGDSTTEWGFVPRFAVNNSFFSDAENLPEGDGIFTLYDDSTASWAANGDTVGARTTIRFNQRNWLESGAAAKGVCVYVPSAFAPYGSPEGTPIPFTISATEGMGWRDEAPWVFGQILNGQRFSISSVQALSGDVTQNILGRLPDAFDRDTFGRLSSRRPSVVVVLSGINDITGITDDSVEWTIEDVKGWLTEMKDYILGRGAKAVFGNLVTESPDAETIALIADVNAHLASMAVAGSVYVVDYHTACGGVAGAQAGPHFTTLGAKLAGAALAEVLEAIAGHGQSCFALGSGLVNLIENGALDGSTGELVGMTGEAAVKSTFTGAGGCVASKETAARQHDWQVYTITGAADGDELLIEFVPLWEIGQNIQGGVDVDVTGDGISNVDCVIECRNADESRIELFRALTPASGMAMGALAGILRTVDIVVPSYYDHGRFYVKAILSAGDTVLKIRNAGVRHLIPEASV